MNLKYKVAFIGWNPFQLIYIRELLNCIDNAKFIIEKRLDNNEKSFSKELLEEFASKIVVVPQKDILNLDNEYDVIIAQTVITDIEKFKKAKIVFIQYGYAKAPHNYGSWRVFADLSLVYGDFAHKRLSVYAPSVVTGNLKYDNWYSLEFHKRNMHKYSNKINRNKRTILYVPTWGDLSSFDIYLEAILSLSRDYNVFIKVHHNTNYLEPNRLQKLKNINFFGLNDDILDLLSVSDIVISDYSGAIFDAVYCNKPLVLLDIQEDKLKKSKKYDKNSLEFKDRNILGSRVSSPQVLKSVIENIDLNNFQNKELLKLKEELFVDTKNAKNNIIKAIYELMNNKYKKSDTQQYLYDTIVKCYINKPIKERIKKKLVKLYLYLISIWRNR